MRRFLVGVWRRPWNRARLFLAAGEADSFLASYPKSGRTWFRFILANYLDFKGQLGVGVDLHSMFTIVPNFDFDTIRGIRAFRFKDRRPGLPLILVSHHVYGRLLFRGQPVIFMVRDPRDVMVSAYFHATRHKHRFRGDMAAFLRDPQQGLPSLVRYLNAWAEGLPRHRHIVVSYENLSADPEAVTESALAFLGRSADTEAVRRAVATSRFEAMREREIEGGIPAHEYDRGEEESLRMRRGKIGGFVDYLTADDTTFIEDCCAETLTPAARQLLAPTGFLAA